MFTLEQINTAHAKVKSGADFPSYIKEIKKLGVTHYESYVRDGHVDYHGLNNYTLQTPRKYEPKSISENVKTDLFTSELLAHQQGKTDYITFITMCAETGIEKWEINLNKMTCTYFDNSGKVVIVESIPQ